MTEVRSEQSLLSDLVVQIAFLPYYHHQQLSFQKVYLDSLTKSSCEYLLVNIAVSLVELPEPLKSRKDSLIHS